MTTHDAAPGDPGSSDPIDWVALAKASVDDYLGGSWEHYSPTLRALVLREARAVIAALADQGFRVVRDDGARAAVDLLWNAYSSLDRIEWDERADRVIADTKLALVAASGVLAALTAPWKAPS